MAAGCDRLVSWPPPRSWRSRRSGDGCRRTTPGSPGWRAGWPRYRGVSLDPGAFPTNILIADLDPAVFGSATDALARLRERGVLAGAAGGSSIRLVTHADVGDADVDRCVEAFRELSAGELKRGPRRRQAAGSFATTSISTRAPAGSAPTWTVERAGRWSPNRAA